jgi:hypothetical protein
MYLIKLASIECCPETIDEGTVDVALVLATSLPNLVEVAEHKPTTIICRFVGNKFLEEAILEIGSRRPIHTGDLENAVIVI